MHRDWIEQTCLQCGFSSNAARFPERSVS